MSWSRWLNWGWRGVYRTLMEFADGDADTNLSPAGRARLKYSAGSDEMLLSKNGAAYVSLIAGGAGGGVVANLTDLGNLDDTLLNDGAQVNVETLDVTWTLSKTAGLTPDGITVIQADSGAPAVWVRGTELSNRWSHQAAWYINQATGDDENDGALATPLATLAELSRRIGRAKLAQNTTINIVDVTGETADFFFNPEIPSGIVVQMLGTRTAVGAFSTLTAFAAANNSTPAQATDGSGPPWVEGTTLMEFEDGPAVGCITWPTSIAANVAEINKPIDPESGATIPVTSVFPANGNRFQLYSLTGMPMDVYCSMSGDGALVWRNLDFAANVTVGASQTIDTAASFIMFAQCSLSSYRQEAGGFARLGGCYVAGVCYLMGWANFTGMTFAQLSVVQNGAQVDYGFGGGGDDHMLFVGAASGIRQTGPSRIVVRGGTDVYFWESAQAGMWEQRSGGAGIVLPNGLIKGTIAGGTRHGILQYSGSNFSWQTGNFNLVFLGTVSGSELMQDGTGYAAAAVGTGKGDAILGVSASQTTLTS